MESYIQVNEPVIMSQIFYVGDAMWKFLIVIFERVTFQPDILFNVSLFTRVSDAYTIISDELD